MVINLVKIFALVLALFPFVGTAQVITVPDPGSVEAYINDHKKQRSLLRARAILEEGNTLLHKASMNTTGEYKDINICLDNYQRAFDIIDLVYSSASTAFNFVKTYNTIKEDVSKYKDLLAEYNEFVLQRGNVSLADTALIKINARAINEIADECEDIYNVIGKLALYGSGKVNCTTALLMSLLDELNASMDNIQKLVHQAYFRTFEFIKVRTRYWKASLYMRPSKTAIGEGCFGRWIETSKSVR